MRIKPIVTIVFAATLSLAVGCGKKGDPAADEALMFETIEVLATGICESGMLDQVNASLPHTKGDQLPMMQAARGTLESYLAAQANSEGHNGILVWAGQTKGGRPHKFAGQVVAAAQKRCGTAIAPLAAERLTASLAGFFMARAADG
jgi:hypothetical protein